MAMDNFCARKSQVRKNIVKKNPGSFISRRFRQATPEHDFQVLNCNLHSINTNAILARKFNLGNTVKALNYQKLFARTWDALSKFWCSSESPAEEADIFEVEDAADAEADAAVTSAVVDPHQSSSRRYSRSKESNTEQTCSAVL